MNITWLLLVLPLFSAAVILLWFRDKPFGAQVISISAVAIAFVLSIELFQNNIEAPEPWVWIDTGALKVEIGMYVDDLARLMLLVVTGVGLLVHIFSVGYMKSDPSCGRFFGKLCLFIFSMLGIVVASNLVMMFIFWDLVGLSSYLLIGFWFEKPAAADAAKKAFIVNKMGDFGFLLGILMFWYFTGTVMLKPEADYVPIDPAWVNWIAVLLFCGCVGKSAMIPLHVWLPDAMEGPTPVSALIHAATMVAAGVYMLCRIFFVLEMAPIAMQIIAGVGCLTALLAALVATQQNDIKRILAYSTLSQLGYMVMAVGSGGPGAAMFHLTTHACFKALLFLGAGSVIYAMHHEQDIWKMGGLRRQTPLTFWTFLIGALALIGLPPFAGFFSKDEILLVALHTNKFFFAMATVTVGLTGFYMARLFLVAFMGQPRSEQARHAQESSPWMILPLCILAVPSLLAGFGFFGVRDLTENLGPEINRHGSGWVTALSLGMLGLGVATAWYWYREATQETVRIPLFANKFYVDEFYDGVLVRFQQAVARILAWIDNWILGVGIVRGSAAVVNLTGEILRLFQVGNLSGYSFLFSLGVVVVVYLILGR